MKTAGQLRGIAAAMLTAGLVSHLPFAQAEQVMEEVTVTARLQDSAEALISERMNDDVVADYLGSDMISRIGDSNVAAALRRVAGLSLVNDKFVYVRGLGERYSSSTLNGATIPSPDLTRNVIPLDIFPTAIVESLAVQKAYSPERSATFGGGNIDIRTKGIPDSFTYAIEFSGGYNSEVQGGVWTYNGGGDDDWGEDDGTRALSAGMTDSLNRFRGNLSVINMLNTLQAEGNNDATLADAQVLNREVALDLNRNLSVFEDSDEPDWGLKASIGNNFYPTDNFEIGFLLGASYSSKWRETETVARDTLDPEQLIEEEIESTRSVDLNTNLNFGIRFTGDHEISTTSMYLRNTDDEVAIIDSHDTTRPVASGVGIRDTRLTFEERELVVNQVKGTHYIGPDTRELLPFLPLGLVPEDLRIDWRYSDATAGTEIPNEAVVRESTITDPITAEVLSTRVATNSNASRYRFTTLDDDVENYASRFTWPISTAASIIEISGGAEHSKKARTYSQLEFALGPETISDTAFLDDEFSEVFSDASVTDPANGFVFGQRGSDTRSYLAATMTDAYFGKIDWTWNDTWRVAAGARWEDYKQVSLPWAVSSYDTDQPQVTLDENEILDAIYSEDKVYPSVSLTYMGDLWAEIFQLRFGWSETVVRPDLREITDASYVDARTGFLTNGNADVVPSDITNFDLRAEWFFSNGDNLTVTLFYKDLENPIDFFERAASDTNRSREVLNAESAEITGLEIEGLKELAFMGEFMEAFFVQGNVTLQDSELVTGPNVDDPTSDIRPLAGASDYVVNMLLGFDSLDGQHSATLTYNVFGERLFSAGRNPRADTYEQPFNSLDLTYSWYPTDSLTVKAKAQNLLDESISIEAAGIEVFEEKPGMGVSLSVEWAL